MQDSIILVYFCFENWKQIMYYAKGLISLIERGTWFAFLHYQEKFILSPFYWQLNDASLSDSPRFISTHISYTKIEFTHGISSIKHPSHHWMKIQLQWNISIYIYVLISERKVYWHWTILGVGRVTKSYEIIEFFKTCTAANLTKRGIQFYS